MGGHAGVGHVPQHLAVIADFEFLGKTIQSEFVDLLSNSPIPFNQVFEVVGGHLAGGIKRWFAHSFMRSLARNALKEGQMSSLRSISTVWKFGAWIRRNTFSIELS